MHIFLYEWATGGGLVDEPGGVPPSLLREGATMMSALAADLARIDGCRVSALRDMRVLDLVLPGCEIIDIHTAVSRDEEFQRLSAAADQAILIAPEFDRILISAANDACAAGGTLLSPSPEFVRVAGNKQRTAERLTMTGVPTPHAIVLDPEVKPPADFRYPAVLKPIDGAGSQDVQLLVGPHDVPRPYAWPRRLEYYCPGLAVSVAFLCGMGSWTSLPPCRQRLSADGRLRYLGGELPLTDGLARRAIELGERTLDALPAATGYVGIDLVLGTAPDGSEDYVIEVNPRLTTSYVGLRAACLTNLAEAMIEAAQGNPLALEFSAQPLEFDTDGNVSYARTACGEM